MFAYATDLLSRMAAVLSRDDDAKKYAALFDDIKAAFNKAYVSEDGHIQGDTQAGYALALHFELLPEKMRPWLSNICSTASHATTVICQPAFIRLIE